MPLIEDIRAALYEPEAPAQLTVTGARRPGKFDLYVQATHPWWDLGRLREARLKLSGRPEVDAINGTTRLLRVRLSDAAIDKFSNGAPEIGETAVAGRRIVVDYCDPNATKALHVGHLRNLAIGNALAASLEEAGAHICRQSVVCDIGRSVTEALVGYDLHTARSEESSLKGDHLVGRCYAESVKTQSEGPDSSLGPVDRPMSREFSGRQDRFDSVYDRWRRRDPGVLRTWLHMRDLVIFGHTETLLHLGVRMDRLVFESEWNRTVEDVVKAGVEGGLFERHSDGDIVFQTGLEEQPELLLMRGDGFPTVHLRTLAVWLGLDHGLDGVEVVQVIGDEWRSQSICLEQMIDGLLVGTRRSTPTSNVFHGMVEVRGATVKSSSGDVLLIDDLLATLSSAVSRHPRLKSLEQGDEVASAVALGLFLGRPSSETLEIEVGDFQNPDRNTVLLMLEAWAEARRFGSSERPGKDAVDGDFRFAVMQAQMAASIFPLVCERREPAHLTRFCGHAARWYLEEPRSPGVSLVVADLLERGLRGLGLLTSYR